jgi:hypothetical protein
MNISLPTAKYAKPDQQIAFYDELQRRVAALPGVRDVAVSAALPLHWIRVTPVLPEGQPDVPLPKRPFIDIEAVSTEWFSTMRVPRVLVERLRWPMTRKVRRLLSRMKPLHAAIGPIRIRSENISSSAAGRNQQKSSELPPTLRTRAWPRIRKPSFIYPSVSCRGET